MSIITCPLLDELSWVQHGFYSRADGVTNSITGQKTFDRFNDVMFLPQTHSDTVIHAGDAIPETGADASFTEKDDLALAIKTADCSPILIACRTSKMVAAVHAGWPGGLNQILPKTITAMQNKGASPEHMVAAIGPCLHQESFAFGQGDDLHKRFISEQPYSAPYFEPYEDHWKFDLAGLLGHQMQLLGVKDIWICPVNTFTSPEHFSYRQRLSDPASEKGRNISVISKINP